MFQNNFIGIIGIVIALLGVGTAVFHDDLQPFSDSTTNQVKDRVVEKGAELLGIEVEQKRDSDWVRLLQFGFGFIGIILGVVSWVRNLTDGDYVGCHDVCSPMGCGLFYSNV